MTSDCTHTGGFRPSKPRAGGGMQPAGRGAHARRSPNFELIDGLLYRKKLERGFMNYREVLSEDRRHEAVSTFHQRRPGQRHLSLEETYKCVAENYWWEGMYFQIRDFVLSCSWCQKRRSKKSEELKGQGCVTKTIMTHGADVLSKLRSQREAGLFCDTTLRTSGRSFSAHRAVLAAVSDHFHEIFTEMDSSKRADIDLTGFSEDGLLSLLDFSYSSTLCVRQEDLPEVCAMARHLGMWPAVEACSALLKEQGQIHPCKAFPSPCAGAYREHHRQKREEDLGCNNMNESFSLTLDTSDDSLQESPRRNLRRTPKSQGHNGLPMSPSHRMKLMDFKSPSSKKATTPHHAVPTSQSTSYSAISQPNARLLRSSPGAAKEVQRLLPMAETPRKSRKSNCITSRFRPSTACSPARVKQEAEEVGEDEQDFARAQEKYKLMNVLGLQRTALLPRPEDLIGWRQKKRLRKLKVNNYSLTQRRKPRPTSPVLSYGEIALSLPLCNPVTTRLISKCAKIKPGCPIGAELIIAKKQKRVKQLVPPTDRSMRSKGGLPDLFHHAAFGGRELRRSVRKGDDGHLHSHQPRRHSSSSSSKTHNKTNTVRIKAEPAEYSISGFKLLSDNHSEHAAHTSLPSQRTQVCVETTKTPRYNSSRLATKAKTRRGSRKETNEMKCKTREDARKVGSQGPKVKDTEPNGLQESDSPSPIYQHPLYKAIKEEPAEPVPVVGPFPDPPSPDLGKRQSKPPIKLLDSGFLFSFCRPAGGPMAGLKKEEESVDICLTRSVSRVGQTFEAEESPHRSLRARGTPVRTAVKREKTERKVTERKAQKRRTTSQNTAPDPSRRAGSKPSKTMPKVNNKQQSKLTDTGSKSCVVLDAVRRARLKQLRGPRSQAPKVPKAAHACLQCPAAYQDCDALIMHRIRHIEGKHWPCPLCSKTFFRLKNVRNHIRTHDPKLYKCRSCIVAGS